MSTRELPTSDSPSDEIPVTPPAEVWRRMSPREREAHILQVYDALENARELMGEGRPHATAKMGAISTLGDFFQRIGRRMFLASELPVLYPGEMAFEPDLLAVRDVEDLGYQDERDAWVVADEGRGPDLILEILYKGSRNKALVRNVARYARLGIPEYFVYDRLKQRLYGYRLVVGAPRYESIPSRGGGLGSAVLGLDLRVVEGRLRFYYGEAMVPEARELIQRLDAMLDERERGIEAETAARQQVERQLQEEEEARQLAREELAREREARLSAEARADEEARARADEARARADEARARAALEARVAALTAELEARRTSSES